MTFKLAVAQLDLVVGDPAGNARKIVVLDAAREARAWGTRLSPMPELSIAGHAAEDPFPRPVFTEACDDAVKAIRAAPADPKDMVVVVGHVVGGRLRRRSAVMQMRHNAASAIKEDSLLEVESLLPCDVFGAIPNRRMRSDEDAGKVVKADEHRRRRVPAGIQGSRRSFGEDWRYPITSKFNETAGAGKP